MDELSANFIYSYYVTLCCDEKGYSQIKEALGIMEFSVIPGVAFVVSLEHSTLVPDVTKWPPI